MNIQSLAVTMGDPAGIGSEVLAKALAHRSSERPLLIVGVLWALERGAEVAGLPLTDLQLVEHPNQQSAPVALMDLGIRIPNFRFGEVDAECGRLAVQAVETAGRLCLDGDLAGMVTCPINKEALRAGGVSDIGHQEILGRLAGASWTATMLMTPGLRVVHLSTHKSLIEAARYVTRENLLDKLRLTSSTLADWGLPQAHIAVAALNPHAGDGGLIGREEIDEIAPAVAEARREGLKVTGPVPADSVFNRAIDGEFDVVLAMYHDQGHIAIKVHNFHESTTATLGIPFLRTSVDHGTAFDIAGRGVASERGLLAALDVADALLAGQLARL
ncbi:MAG: 4-hydroxythreonine-4-phosphate dehydrogenase PdxA [Gammaproteobacteria bacterium]|nr:4-hydroxythreonine-4-phosphate dehydrogenase PdxA [Gammaproteobacteria bacterium]